MKIWHDYIRKLDPKVDFGEMTAGEWQVCIDIVKEEAYV